MPDARTPSPKMRQSMSLMAMLAGESAPSPGRLAALSEPAAKASARISFNLRGGAGRGIMGARRMTMCIGICIM